MNQFTFGILTYNHREYIIEHLESIKYQILNHGDFYKINLILADDFSNDDTVKIAQKWLERNKKIFHNYKILTTGCNLGIVKNFSRLLKEIQTERFKILAGDDLYYKNNIFLLPSDCDIILTNPVKFNHGSLNFDDKLFTFKRMLVEKDVRSFVSNRLHYGNCIEAPGVFFKRRLLNDELFRKINEFNWIEDMPMWDCFFNRTDIMVRVIPEVFVLYRVNVGISCNLNHSKRLGYEQDLNKVRNTFFTKDRFPYDRILVWDKSIFKKKLKYYYNKTPIIKEFNIERDKVKVEGIEYLNEIRNKARLFLREFNFYSVGK